MPFVRPQYPAILTHAEWGRRKGLMAKFAGRTGVGVTMEKCERLYGAVDWEALELSRGMALRDFTQSEWRDRLDKAKRETTGRLRSFVEALYELRDVARRTGDSFARNPLISRASAEQARAVGSAAAELGVALGASTITRTLQDDFQLFLSKLELEADRVPADLRAALDRTPAALDEVERLLDKTPIRVDDVNAATARIDRDLAQQVGAISLFIERRGLAVAGVDASALPHFKEHYRSLSAWGEGPGVFRAGATAAHIRSELGRFRQACDALAARLR